MTFAQILLEFTINFSRYFYKKITIQDEKTNGTKEIWSKKPNELELICGDFLKNSLPKNVIAFRKREKDQNLSVAPKTLRTRLNDRTKICSVGRDFAPNVMPFEYMVREPKPWSSLSMCWNIPKESEIWRERTATKANANAAKTDESILWEKFLIRMNINRGAGSLRAPLCSWILHALMYSLEICTLPSYGIRQTIVSIKTERQRNKNDMNMCNDINDLVENQNM